MPGLETLEAILKIVREEQTKFGERLDRIEREQARCEVEQALQRGKILVIAALGSMALSGAIAWIVK